MPRLALTEKTVAKLPAKTGRQTLYWDDGPRAVRGFGVLCSGTTHNKAFVVQRDLPGGRTRRVTIGGVNELSVEDARKRAADLVLEMRRGVDPKARVICATLRETMHAYRRARGDALRGRSLEHYSQIERYVGDWMDRPLTEITRERVEHRHKKISAAASDDQPRLSRTVGRGLFEPCALLEEPAVLLAHRQAEQGTKEHEPSAPCRLVPKPSPE